MSSERDQKEHNEQTHTTESTGIQEPTQECAQSCAELQDKLLRVTADFQNYKMRTERERMQSIQIGQIAVITRLLSIVDDVERAMIEAKKQGNADLNWLTGFELIAKSLNQLLTDYRVLPIEQIKTFDPELHEALTQVDAPDHQSGDIVVVLQKGYVMDSRVLRPAKVTVAK